MRLPEVVRGACQSLFQRDRVHRVPVRIRAEQSPPTHFLLLELISDFSIPHFSVIEFASSTYPLDKNGRGTQAVVLGLDPKTRYSGVNLFLLNNQPEESPRLVTEQHVSSFQIVGRATDEQLKLAEEELEKVKSRTRAFEGGAFRGNRLT